MADVLSQLFAFKWRDVEVPITKMRLSIAHDLVEHKYWGVDGARIEDTGGLRHRGISHLITGIQPAEARAHRRGTGTGARASRRRSFRSMRAS